MKIYYWLRNIAENWRANLLRIIFLLTTSFSIYFMIKGYYILGSLNILTSMLMLPLFILTLPIKQYKTYFDKKDTPFRQDFQPNKKHHVVWYRMAYDSFLKYKTVKIKWLGIITLKDNKEAQDV